MTMKYLVVYEFDQTVEKKEFYSKNDLDFFLKDEGRDLCQDGGFVKYYIIEGDFTVTPGFVDRA